MTSMTRNINVATVVGAVALATALWSAPTLAADAILSGQVKRPNGKPLEGVTISAKAQGSSITTSVFTDMDGYYYLPALPVGQYRLRAQAVTFGTQTAIVDANSKKKQDFALAPLKDFVRQLSGADLLAAMPQDTPEDSAMHRILRSQCVACHSAGYGLQQRFDPRCMTLGSISMEISGTRRTSLTMSLRSKKLIQPQARLRRSSSMAPAGSPPRRTV